MWYLAGFLGAAAAIALLLYDHDVVFRPFLRAISPSADEEADRRARDIVNRYRRDQEPPGDGRTESAKSS